jgi:undecaprenyl-diphosphatase
MGISLSYFQSIILGIIQGVTELFPVSSLGHSVLIPALFGWHNLVSSQSATQSFFVTFLIGLHFGTAVGLFVFYRQRWLNMFRAFVAQVTQARTNGLATLWRLNAPGLDPEYRLLGLLVVGTIPVAIIGFVLEKPLRELFAKPEAAAIFLALNGVVLLAGERLKRQQGRHARSETLDQLSPRAVVRIGFAQSLSLFAGISRSGVSMVAGMVNGLATEESANFAFLLGTPVILIAALYKLPTLFGAAGNGVRMQTLVGALFAAVAAYISVAFLTKWFATKNLRPFAIYCLVAGVLCAVRFL